MIHDRRRDRLRATIASQGLRALVVTDLSDIRYLTGFSGSNAVLVVGADADDDLLGTDGRYAQQVRDESPDLTTVIDRDTLVAVGGRVAQWRLGATDDLPVRDMGALPPSTRFMPSPVRELRRIKDDLELGAIAHACAITATAFEALADEIAVGDSEVMLARRLEQLFAAGGAQDRAFATIVAAGASSAIPHHEPSDYALKAGDLVVIDAGARVDGYCADMTRTYVVGAEPEPWQARLYDVVREAQRAATAGYIVDADCREVDAIARTVIENAGWGEYFGHGLGHGLGLDIHEAPMISPRASGSIIADMAITVEPGVYLPGRGGVRIEDTLAVTAAGPVVLTQAPRDLRVVG